MNNTDTIRLRNKNTGLYYVQDRHFSGTWDEASIVEKATAAVIRHSYENVENVLGELPPTSLIAKKDHCLQPKLVSGGRGSKTYFYMGWLITVSRWNERSYAFGTSRSRSGNQFYAYRKDTNQSLDSQGGGIRNAKQIIDRLTATANA